MPENTPTKDELYNLNATRPDSMVVWMGALQHDANGQPHMNSEQYLSCLNTFLLYATTVMPKFGMRTIVQSPVAALNKPKVNYAQVAIVPYAETPDLNTPPTHAGELIYGGLHGMVYDMEKSMLKTPVLFDRTQRVSSLRNNAFYLFADSADWRQGSCLLFFGLRNAQVTPSQDLFLAQMQKCMMRIQDKQLPGQDGAVFATDGEILFYVEHFRTAEAASTKNTDMMASLAELLVLGQAADMQAPASIEAETAGYQLTNASVMRHMFNVPEKANLQQYL